MRRLVFQRFVGHLCLLPLGFLIILLLRFRGRYKLKHHRQLRKRFKEVVASGDPILICPNHLTLIDSVILLWAFGSIPWYLFHYRCFAWNVPAVENVKSKVSWRFITYISKCVLIDRSGGTEYRNLILADIRKCLRRGDIFMVFPEGTRSRSGLVQVDNVIYGVGRIIQGVPGIKVLCVYIRGDEQDRYSAFPKKGERIGIELEMIAPTSANKGLRAVRDYSRQVIGKLKEMEDRYHIRRGKEDAQFCKTG